MNLIRNCNALLLAPSLITVLWSCTPSKENDPPVESIEAGPGTTDGEDSNSTSSDVASATDGGVDSTSVVLEAATDAALTDSMVEDAVLDDGGGDATTDGGGDATTDADTDASPTSDSGETVACDAFLDTLENPTESPNIEYVTPILIYPVAPDEMRSACPFAASAVLTDDFGQEPEVYVARASNAATGQRTLLVHATGAPCGSQGCPMGVFSDRGFGYEYVGTLIIGNIDGTVMVDDVLSFALHGYVWGVEAGPSDLPMRLSNYGPVGGLPNLSAGPRIHTSSCNSATDCTIIRMPGFPAISNDGKFIAVAHDRLNESLDLWTLDTATGAVVRQIALVGPYGLVDAMGEVSTTGETAIDEQVAENAVPARELLEQGWYSSMQPLADARLVASYDFDSEEIVLHTCFTEDCFSGHPTDGDLEVKRIPHPPAVEQTFGETTCTAPLSGYFDGAIDQKTGTVLLKPLMYTEDLCDVEFTYVITTDE